jgi:hypothetical protein
MKMLFDRDPDDYFPPWLVGLLLAGAIGFLIFMILIMIAFFI